MKHLQNAHSILIVSNVLKTWTSAINAIEALGYGVETSEGGVLALSRLDHQKPDLLVIDNSLKDLNAPEVIRIVRYAYPRSKLPVILVIHGQFGGHHRVIDDEDVNAIVLKPDLETLKRRVTSLLDPKRTASKPSANKKQSPWSHVEKLLLMNKRLKSELQQSKRIAQKLQQDASKQHAIESTAILDPVPPRSSRDKLTGLIERTDFEFRLERTLSTVRQSGGEHTLLFLKPNKLDRFIGGSNSLEKNNLLRQIAQLLQSHARKRDSVAYLGNSEFAILMEHCSVDQARRLLTTLRKTTQAHSFIFQGKKLQMNFHIGVVPVKNQHSYCNAIIDEARQTSVQSHRNNSSHRDRHGERKRTATLAQTRATKVLETAINEGRLQLYYQPIESLGHDTEAIRYELFVRMQDQYGRFIRPGAFLPATERYNLITHLDQWVISTALAWLARHSAQLNRLALCCINMSGQSLFEETQHEFIAKQFAKTKIPPQKICFEINETAAITDVNNAGQWMENLRKLGCCFALDDFGSGLSSLAYLKNLPAEYVKIDGRFIKNLTCSSIDLAMVRSINETAHVMGKQTIAEMVEDEKVVDTLREIGIDYVQGYAIGRPLPLKALILDSMTTSTAR